jgi:hypothetical protein
LTLKMALVIRWLRVEASALGPDWCQGAATRMRSRCAGGSIFFDSFSAAALQGIGV